MAAPTPPSLGRIVTDAFERGDTWFATTDRFRREVDGDYWLVGD